MIAPVTSMTPPTLSRRPDRVTLRRVTPPPITDISDPRWLRAIAHPLRIRLLSMLDEERASPVVLAGKVGLPLGTGP